MAFINFNNVSVEFPVYNANGRSLKKRLIQVATGGRLDADPNGRVVVKALHNLTFNVYDGDRVGIVGHNGAGKSTLLRLLSGVYPASSGVASVQGKIGSLIDISLGIDPEASGRENICMRAALLGISKAELKKEMENIIEFSELGDFIEMPVRTYSTGMHLRLAFSVSTIIRPEILLMDEWLSVGDQGFCQKAEIRMAELVKSSNILIIASHSKDLILKSCSRALWLDHGCIRMDASAEDVCSAYFNG